MCYNNIDQMIKTIRFLLWKGLDPMLFVVDVGNTNMEFGVYNGVELVKSFRLVTRRDITSDEVGLTLRQFLSIYEIPIDQIEDVMISSVVPEVNYSIKNAMRKYLFREPLIIQENIPVPIQNRYRNQAEVGADRLVTAYSAYRKYGGNLVVIDFGTATTFDLVDGEGAYLGGSIFPGIKISLEALASRCSKLPRVEISVPPRVVGRNTVEAMQSGLVYGYSGAVIHMVRQMEEELGCPLKVVATGGLARIISEQSKIVDVIDRNLLLDGLAWVYDEYKKGQEAAT